MGISFSYEDSKKEFKIPVEFKKIVKEIEFNEKRKLEEICFIFVSRKKILSINQAFLKHDYVTDVITFNYNVRHTIRGDIYVCRDKVFENAIALNVSRAEEIRRVMIHGILHLVGYSDDNQRVSSIMREREDFYLRIAAEKGYWDERCGL